MLAIDLSHLPLSDRRKVHEIFTRGEDLALLRAVERQKHIKRHYERHRPRSRDGLGGQTTAIDPYFIRYFKLLYGDDAWDDPHKRAFILKRNEELRVRHTGTRDRLLVTGARSTEPGARAVKFHKAYA